MVYQDRHYSVYQFIPRWTERVKILIIINAIVFLIQHYLGWEFTRLFGLIPQSIWQKGMLWQLFTYMFLHGGIFHLLFNMFTLWMFGSDIEKAWGGREFLKYYFITGLGAALTTMIFSWNSSLPTIGASGAIYGILLAYGLTFPDRIVYLYLLFPLKAKHLVILFGLIELFFSFSYKSDGIGHFAHLGGLLTGYLYLRLGGKVKVYTEYIMWRWEQRKMKKITEQTSNLEDLKEEVNRILDKISKEGMETLTSKERKTLKKASELFRG